MFNCFKAKQNIPGEQVVGVTTPTGQPVYHISKEIDPPLTRKDMEHYVNAQIVTREEDIKKLRTELERVQAEYKNLSEKHKLVVSKLQEEHRVNDELTQKAIAIDDAAIDKFVQSLLDNPDINVSGLPDFMERALYTRFAKMALGGIEKIFETTAFEFVGHRIQLSIKPVESKVVDGEEI